MHEFNVLISSGGRRVSLMNCFREAIRDAGFSGRVLTVDNSAIAPAFHLADGAWTVPPCSDPEFVNSVLTIARANNVRLIVPTIDPELPVYARSRDLFLKHGITVSIADEASIAIASDKWKTYEWLSSQGFPTVRTAPAESALAETQSWEFPLIVKPRGGSASIGVARVNNRDELVHAVCDREDLIAQEIATGAEYTINLYVNAEGVCLASVPHRRMQTRGGEVAKGVTEKYAELMDLGKRIAESLPGMRGAMNVQCFFHPVHGVRVIEINARFGGGYPLAHRAGARFTHWLIAEAMGRTVGEYRDDWADRLLMLRYDQECFLPLDACIGA
jgi:carbamoyl-phosphate synthase large subunit